MRPNLIFLTLFFLGCSGRKVSIGRLNSCDAFVYRIINNGSLKNKLPRLLDGDSLSKNFVKLHKIERSNVVKIVNLINSENSYGGGYTLTFSTEYSILFDCEKNKKKSVEVGFNSRRISSNCLLLPAQDSYMRRLNIQTTGIKRDSLRSLFNLMFVKGDSNELDFDSIYIDSSK